MPRRAREKNAESIYHVMCRSVSEYQLFRDEEDKAYYLGLLKRYKDRYECRIYAYCLMDNHLHLQLDPRGFDISRFMHSVNVAYVRYYNRKYQRHGPVFQDRFESRILDSDGYNLTVSAYIHNNSKDIQGYAGKEEEYPYSSYGIYTGRRKDYAGIIDTSFIMGIFNTRDKERFAQRYREFAKHQRDIGTTAKEARRLSRAIENEYISGRRIIQRELKPSMVVCYISGKLMINRRGSLMLKAKKRLMEYRAICAYTMRVLCGMTYRGICENMYNITVSACSLLCSRGYELIRDSKEYGMIFNELMSVRTA